MNLETIECILEWIIITVIEASAGKQAIYFFVSSFNLHIWLEDNEPCFDIIL